MTRTGQKTRRSRSVHIASGNQPQQPPTKINSLCRDLYAPGMSQASNIVATMLSAIARVALCQNLNSGNRRMNGLNSSSCFVGKADCPPPSISSSCSSDGSNFGVKKARNKLSRYIPSV